MRLFYFILLAKLLVVCPLCAQHLFQSIRLPVSAKLSALGGANVSSTSALAFVFDNPALLSASPAYVSGRSIFSPHNRLELSFLRYYAGMNAFETVFARRYGAHIGAIGVRAFSYGDMARYDETGAPQGQFRASEYMFSMAYAHTIGDFAFGVSLKPGISAIDTYRAYALHTDLGAVYHHPVQAFSFGIVLKNIGINLGHYAITRRYNPLDVWIGASVRPAEAFFRLSLTAKGLVSGVNENYVDTNGPVESLREDKPTISRLLAHTNLSIELFLKENIILMGGLDFQRLQRLRTNNSGPCVGLSGVLFVELKAFDLGWSIDVQHTQSVNMHFSLGLNFDAFIKEK